MMNIDDEKFERLWQENKRSLLDADAEYRQVTENFKMSTSADWLLFGTPVLVGIICVDQLPISHELLKWLASAFITVIAFFISVLIKSRLSGGKSISEIEQRVKAEYLKKLNNSSTLSS